MDDSRATGEVSLEVQDCAGVPRASWPVTGGVPFGRGELADPEDLSLTDSDGNPLRLQCEPLARWEDGSVKWLLVDFTADLAPHESVRYTLRFGKGVRPGDAPGPPLSWVRTGGGVFVDTGCLRAEIGPRLLESLSVRDDAGSWVDVVAQPGEMWITVEGERAGRYLSSLDSEAEVAVEQAGPNRLCVRISGWHHSASGGRFGPYTLRVHACAGQRYLRIFHTFVNSDLPERARITGIGLRVPVSLGERRAVDYGGVTRAVEGGWSGWLAQADWDAQEIVHDGLPLPSDGPVAGYLALQGADATAGCIVRNWAQLHPKKLEVDRRGLTLWIWPPDSGPFDLRREEQKQTEEWRWFREHQPALFREWNDPGTAPSAGISARRYREALMRKDLRTLANSSAFGLARTHEFLLTFSAGKQAPREMRTLTACLEEPLLPFVSPRTLDRTGALGPLGWEDRDGFPEVESYFRRKLDWIVRHRDEWTRWWGILDWGGLRFLYETLRETTIPGRWFCVGRHGWNNGEVDIPNHIMYHYLRTGDRRIFHFYESILRHQMDVDTIHLNLPEFEAPGHEWQSGEWTRGGIHRHSYNHYSGGANIGHTWNEGFVNYYFLTGDRRARDVALDVGEYSLGSPVGKVQSTFDARTTHPRPDLRFERSASNAYRNALKCYEMTREERWKREALRWRKHFLDHSPEYLDQQPATFHVTTYLVRTFALDYAIFRDPRIGEELVRIARWHCAFMQRGFDQRGLHYPYLACGLAWWIARDDDLLRWPWHTYLAECQSPVDGAQGPGDFQKAEFFEFGQLPFFLRACREAGFSESRPPARPGGE